MSPRRNWDSSTTLSRQRACPSPQNQRGVAHSPAGEGLGESQFRRLEKSLAVCLLCGWTCPLPSYIPGGMDSSRQVTRKDDTICNQAMYCDDWRCRSRRETWTQTSYGVLRSWWKDVNHYTGEGQQFSWNLGWELTLHPSQYPLFFYFLWLLLALTQILGLQQFVSNKSIHNLVHILCLLGFSCRHFISQSKTNTLLSHLQLCWSLIFMEVIPVCRGADLLTC